MSGVLVSMLKCAYNQFVAVLIYHLWNRHKRLPGRLLYKAQRGRPIYLVELIDRQGEQTRCWK